jgi:hypothetical protein
MAHTWMTLNWCSNGSSISSYSLGATGGTASFPGLSYDGIEGKGSLNVGWEIRYYAEFNSPPASSARPPANRFAGEQPGSTRSETRAT